MTTIFTEMEQTTRAMLARGKGILAADESTGTIDKRFKGAGIANTEENRRDYREMLFTTPGMANHTSGVILFEETLFQKARNNTPLSEVLSRQGVVPGIKVDKGTIAQPFCAGEVITVGLDGLDERLLKYKAAGARFAKWRAVITIGAGIPTQSNITANAQALARYAALCQAAGIVPIVEPEVLMDADNTIDTCFSVTECTLRTVFAELAIHRVSLEHMVLKPNMVVSGKKCPTQAGIDEVASKTLVVLKRTVPGAVPGIAFLSGGQSDEDATAHLGAMNAKGALPWVLTFSYGRALQAPAIKAWAGKEANWKSGQAHFLHRAKLNGAAQTGTYSTAMEKQFATV
ncbi:MAG: fructose-bisphosphate aldolase class I [Planctomycetes bacterium]|nr:fructose-bisphosphate aldolase class I [Planctomycetota bacterium]